MGILFQSKCGEDGLGGAASGSSLAEGGVNLSQVLNGLGARFRVFKVAGEGVGERLGREVVLAQFRALESEGILRIPRKMLGKKTVRYRITDINNFILSDDATEKGNDSDKTACFLG